MYMNDNETELKKTKTSENFNKPNLSKKRQFSNEFYEPDIMKDFTRFTNLININTFGSQPIIMYKKIKRMQSPNVKVKSNHTKEKKNPCTSREKITKNVLKNNYVSDGGLQQKSKKYKSKLGQNHSQSPSKKVRNNFKSKTNRSREKNLKREKTQKSNTKKTEFIPKTSKENNYKKIFKKERTNSNLNNCKKEDKKNSTNNNLNINIQSNNKYMTDKNTIEHDEKKKNEYINNLIKNVVACFKKDLIDKKKNNVQSKKLTDRKIDYLKGNEILDDYNENRQENGIVLMNKSDDITHFKIKKLIPPKKMRIQKININNINNMNNNLNHNLHTDNDKYSYANLTNSNNNLNAFEFSKNLIKNKVMLNHDSNDNKINLISGTKRKIKPQINQFEFLEKIRSNFKKIKKLKKEKKESPEMLNDSFRYTHTKINKNLIKNKSSCPNDIPYDENEDIKQDLPNDEFLYADRVTHRTRTELDKFLKKKKLEKKKEENEEMKKKHEKIMNTLQNLIRLGEQCKNNSSSPSKNRIDSKNHLKARKVINEYYVGTESSRNNTSTFIDKQEYYRSILESKNVLINSKIEKTETNYDDNKPNLNNTRNIIVSHSMYKNNSNLQNSKLDNYIENYHKKSTYKNNNNPQNIQHLKDNNNNKLEELKQKVNNSIKRSNEIFSKENIKRIKSDLSENNNNDIIKAKFENQFFIKNINNNINKKINNNERKNSIPDKNKDYANIINGINNLQKIFNIILKKSFFNNLKEKYNMILKKKIAFDFLIGIFKIRQFKKIQDYNEKMKWANSLIRLFTPFIQHKFLLFVQNCRNRYINKLEYFVKKLTQILKRKIMKLLKQYAKVKFFNNRLIPAIKTSEKILLKKSFEKIKNNISNKKPEISAQDINNINNINNNMSYLNKYLISEDKKSNSYIYESLDCEDSISVHPNSVDNDGLHQLKELIEMQTDGVRVDDENIGNFSLPLSNLSNDPTISFNDSFGSQQMNQMNNNKKDFLIVPEQHEERSLPKNNNENKIKTELHLKEHLLQQIINSNKTSSEDIKNDAPNNESNQGNIKENENLIITKINDEKENSDNNEFKKNEMAKINEGKNNEPSKNKNEDIINVIENIYNNDNEDNKNLEKLKEITPNIIDKNKFADDITEYIISNLLLNEEIKSPESKLIPSKSGDFNINKYNDFNLQSINMNNSSDLNSHMDNLSLLSLSEYSQNNSQILEKSMILQYSISSEFNKTIKERKNILETNLYNSCIINKLILLICMEIKNNYARIYDNISIPYKANYEQVLVASYLQDNELLNKSYKELKVKEDLKNILDKNKIIEKFNSLNRKIRKLKGLEENNDYDNIVNRCIVDATIEIINKERPYGESGEPFPFSKREREINFKYNRNDPKPLMRHVYKSLKEMLFGKGNVIKENSPIFDKNDPFLMNIFKKEMGNENIWNELEIQEEQVKSLASSIIFDQLVNEVIEILEHVQLNRKKPELYQNKSIYACDEIPRLSFQMISNNTDNDETEQDMITN